MTEEENLRIKRRARNGLANQYQMSDRSKYELIRKIMDVLEESMEEDKTEIKTKAPKIKKAGVFRLSTTSNYLG